MSRLPLFRTATIFALAGVLAGGALISAPTPAAARVDVSVGINVGGISFGYFHRSLSRYGRWIQHPLWGDVWIPPRARSYRPYFNGYWVFSEFGLLWVSFDPWGDITFHYGRWIWDPHWGWLWIPGYVWGPAWVIFRSGGGFFGWLAMPPDYGYFYDGPYFGGRFGWNDYYGYADWYGLSSDAFFNLWIFVEEGHFYSRDYRNFAFSDSRRVRNIINRTRDITRYEVSGDRMVNRSISANQLERITGQRIRPVNLRQVLKSDVPMATVSGGRGLARQEGTGRPGPRLHDRDFQLIAPDRTGRARARTGPGGEGVEGIDRGAPGDRGARPGPDRTRGADDEGAGATMRRGGRPGGADEDAIMRRGEQPDKPDARARTRTPNGPEDQTITRRGGVGPSGAAAAGGGRRGPGQEATTGDAGQDTESAERPRRTPGGRKAGGRAAGTESSSEEQPDGDPRRTRGPNEGGPDDRRPHR